MKTVLFYDDATEFGGHEKMTVSLVAQIFHYTEFSVVFVHSETNGRFVKALTDLGNQFNGRLSLHPIPFRSGKIPTLEIFWQFSQIVALARLFKNLDPCFAVIVQGNIELSVKGVVASRFAGLYTVSYIPSVHRFGDIGLPFGRLRDLLNRIYYRMIDRFILISDSDFWSLRKSLSLEDDRLFLVRNLLDTARMTQLTKSEARNLLNLPDSPVVITIIGRIYFKGKSQDLAVKALRGMLGDDLRLMIVGDGPDLCALRELARNEIDAGTVIVKEWLDDPSAVYCASDIILMPSILEGVPLVLLEALYFGKKVLASDIPPFDEYLPSSQRFKMRDADALRKCVSSALETLNDPSETACSPPAITLDADVNREIILRLMSFGQK